MSSLDFDDLEKNYISPLLGIMQKRTSESWGFGPGSFDFNGVSPNSAALTCPVCLRET